MCIRLIRNLTGSCGQQQRLREWSRMVLKQLQDGELGERHVIKNEKVALDRLRVRQNVFLVDVYQ